MAAPPKSYSYRPHKQKSVRLIGTTVTLLLLYSYLHKVITHEVKIGVVAMAQVGIKVT